MSIPEGLMKTARELAAQVGRNQAVYYEWDDDVLKRHLAENAEAIASALMAEREAAKTAEREACAQMVDDYRLGMTNQTHINMFGLLASLIRNA